MNRNLPSSGGGYFRLLPYPVSRWMIGRVNREDCEAAVFYFHPWEIDTAQPRIAGIDARTRFRHYVNIPRMESRLQALLGDFRWGAWTTSSCGVPRSRRAPRHARRSPPLPLAARAGVRVVVSAAASPHLQCASRPACRDRSAGSPRAARNPRFAPLPLPHVEEGARGPLALNAVSR